MSNTVTAWTWGIRNPKKRQFTGSNLSPDALENYQQDGFESWEEYKATREIFHIVWEDLSFRLWDGRSSLLTFLHLLFKLDICYLFLGYYFCSCLQAAMRKPCKHGVFVMCKKGTLAYPAEMTSVTLQPSRKRGRPKKSKAGDALKKNWVVDFEYN